MRMTLFCPAGHGEFEDWVAVCPDCGRRLVAESPPVAERAPLERGQAIVLLTRIPNEPLAQLCRQVLEDEGVRVMLKPGGPGFGGWGSAANLEHELYVLESQADDARKILAEFEAEPGETFDEFDEDVAEVSDGEDWDMPAR
jgi:hypothetical protein